MSTTIDSKVVEMRMENSNFEKNAAASIGTLAKLKESLKLTGASKGLEQVNAAAGKVNMRGLGSAVDTVTARFSALQVMGVTALANITNSAVNAGKRMVSALTIDPVKTGFQEYETQINAVQTILANTQSKGTTIDDVNEALEELNKYADKTIYNFTEMTRNIGTFTAAGIDLDTSVNAIQGIANLAAVSGSTSQQASTAMYQLSQALASGTVKLMDWNSVVNAGMGGQVFQDALKETARVHGVAIDDMITANGSFRETLQEGWLTSEILTETLQKFTLTTEGLTEEQIAANREMLRAKGYTEDQIEEIFKLGATATDAATKVKTFTQLWDVLKEAAQSGWSQTWKLFIGDFEEAKALMTPIADTLTGIINNMSDWRNDMLELALSSPFGQLAEKIKNVTGATEAMTSVTKDYSAIVDKVIRGDYGNGQSRWDKLTEEGYDWAKVQNLVNEKLDCSVRHTEQLTEAQEEQNKTQATTIEQLVEMSDAQLRELEFTDKEIEALRELAEQSKKTGIPIEELAKDLDQLSGRNLLINGLKNAANGLAGVFTSMKDAWQDFFPPKSVEERAEKVYDLIAAFHKFSIGLRLTEEVVDENGNTITVLNDTGDKLYRTFRGLAAVASIVSDVVGGGLKIAFNAVKAILGYFHLDILDVTAAIGDALVKFREMTDVSKLFSKAIEFIVPMLISAKDAALEWASSFKNLPWVQEAINKIKESFTSLKEMDFKELGKNIIEGLKNGLSEEAAEVVDKIVNVAKDIITKFCEILGIHSPSTTFFEFGENIIQGLVNGLQNGISWVGETLQGIANACIGFFKGIDWGAVFALGISAGMVYFVKQIADAIGSFANVADAIADITNSVDKVIDNFAKIEKALAFDIRMDGVKKLAIAVAILAGSVIALSFVDIPKLWNAVGVVAALAVILGILAFAMDKMSAASVNIDKNGIELGGVKSGLLAIGASLLIIAATVKIMGSMDQDEAIQGFAGLAGIITAIGAVFAAYGLVTKYLKATNIDKVGGMLLKMSAAMLLLVVISKLIAGMEWDEMGKAAAGIGGLVVFMAALMAISKIGNSKKIGEMLMQMAIAMGILTIVAKTIVDMEWEEMGKAGVGLLGLTGFIAGLMLISKIGNTKKIGEMLLAMAGSMAILAIVAKIIVGMEWEEMGKAAIGLLGLAGVVAVLVGITQMAGKDAPRIAATLLAISVSVGILAVVAMMLSLMSVEGLAKGLVAVGILSVFVAGMIAATSGATACVGNLIVITVAVAVLAAAVAALSLIDPTKLAGATLAMSIVMGMFAIVVASSGMATGAMGTLIVMTVVVGLIGGLLIALAQLPIENTLAASASLSLVLLSMSASLAILTVVGAAAPAALAGMGVLGALIAGLTVVLVALGALTKIPGFNELISDGSGVLSKLGYALGNFVGSIIGGLAAGITSGLPELAANLSMFMMNLTPFITGMKLVDTSVLAGVGILTAAVIALTAAELIAGIGSFLSGGSSFAALGAELSAFMLNAMPFMTGIKMVDPAALEGVKALAEAILILTAADILDGMTSWLTGGNSLGQFGSQLGQLGTDLNTFTTNLGAFDESKVTTVTCAANAIKALAEAASTLPNEGGWAAKILGENSIATFGSYLPKLGSDLSAFATNLGTFGEDKVNTVTCAANAIKSIAEAANGIPNEGGWAVKIFGENSIATFGSYLPSLGENLAAFASNLGTFDDSTVATVTCAANAIKNMAEVSNNIPNEGGWAAKIFGDNSLGAFGEQLASVGTSLKEFVSNLGTFGEGNVATVDAAVKAIKALATLANADLKTAKNNLAGFGDKLGTFGTDLGTFCTNLPSGESITVATNNVKKILDMIEDMSGKDPSILSNFSEKLKKIGTDAVDKFVKAFTSESAKSDVKNAGITLMDKTIDGIESREIAFRKAAKGVADEGADGVEAKKSSFESAGKDLGNGLIDGIEAKEDAVYKAAFALGQAAVRGEKDGQQSNSPSKLTILAGKWLGEGLVVGIGNMTKAVYNAGHDLGESATNSISSTIARIGDAINSDVDAQPTIRPVLDLSDVSSGVSTLNGMLDTNRTVGLMANLNSISALSNSRQNGNDDILSALNKLNKTMSNLPTGTVNNINGITYSNGDEINDAINVLVRATVMQGRV